MDHCDPLVIHSWSFMIENPYQLRSIKKMEWDLVYRFTCLLLTSSLDTHGRLRNSHAPRRGTEARTVLYAADISLDSGCLRFTSQLRSMIALHLQYSTVAHKMMDLPRNAALKRFTHQHVFARVFSNGFL